MAFEEFEALPDTADELELVRGELIRVPPHTREHMRILKRLYRRLDAALESSPRADLGEVEIEMGYLLGSHPRSWLRPDVSITHAGQQGGKYYEGAPGFVFEIVSENEKVRDLERKISEFLRNGALEVWVIYPDQEYALVHRAGQATISREEHCISSPLLPGIEIPFDDFL